MNLPDEKKINKTLDNTSTPDEAKEVIRWFSTQEGYLYLSELIDKDFNNIFPGKENDHIDHLIPSEEMYTYINNVIRWKHKKRFVLKIAAILIPFFLLTTQLWYIDKKINLFDNIEYEEISVPKGERMQLLFQDGSKVSLNSESRIRYPRKFSFSERRVQLEGEAFFEISTNKNRPFIVDLNNIIINVVGTTFNIKAYACDPDIYISLETGKVLISKDTQHIAYLKPGEKATYNKLTKRCSIMKTQYITKSSAWKNNLIVFDNSSLSEVIATLSRWYDVNFNINDSTSLMYSYTLTSHKKSIQQILQELEKIAPVRFVEQENNSYTVLIENK